MKSENAARLARKENRLGPNRPGMTNDLRMLLDVARAVVALALAATVAFWG